jgi:branched-chain amino acid transport system permease protein
MTVVMLETLTLVFIYGLLTLSLNLQYGLTGLLNFGQGLFFAVGGYAVGVVYFHHWPAWIGIVAAPIAGGIAGLLLALPAKRLENDYWALMTLGVAALFLATMNNERAIAGGDLGTYGIPRIEAGELLPILGGVCAIVVVAFERIRRSQFGRVIRALREDPVLVAAIGRDPFQFQMKVLITGGAVGALGGVALAYWLTVVAPGVFGLDQTVIIWTMMIVGGRGNTYGALIGALLLEAVFIGTRFLPDFGGILSGAHAAVLRIVIVGAVLVYVLIVRPEGVLREWKVRHAPLR